MRVQAEQHERDTSRSFRWGRFSNMSVCVCGCVCVCVFSAKLAAFRVSNPAPNHKRVCSLLLPVACCSIALVSLFVESVQLALFTLQPLTDPATPSTASSPSSSSPMLPAWLEDLSAYFYLQAGVFLPDDVAALASGWAGVAISSCLLLLFVVRFLHELRTFGALKHMSQHDLANSFFFHSFAGAIIYGHGVLKGVSKVLSAAAALLSEALFLIVVTQLLSTLKCENDPLTGTNNWNIF